MRPLTFTFGDDATDEMAVTVPHPGVALRQSWWLPESTSSSHSVAVAVPGPSLHLVSYAPGRAVRMRTESRFTNRPRSFPATMRRPQLGSPWH